MTEKSVKKAVIYARVSSETQEERGISLPGQVRDCHAYANQKGYIVVREFEETFTGGELFRPELDKVRDMLGSIDVLIVYEPDRLTRGGILHEMIIEDEFSKAGCEIEFVVGGEKPKTPEQKLTRDIQASIKEYEREIIKRRMAAGRRRVVESGKVVGIGKATAPYGYRYNSDTKMIEVIEEEAQIVRLIYNWYVYGENGKHLGQGTIAMRLFEMQIPTKRRPRRNARKTGLYDWSQATVCAILQSETYAGVWYYNKNTTTTNNLRYKTDKGLWIPVDVPAIIPRELWQAAQDKRLENANLSRRNTPAGVYLMKGRLSCPTCGAGFGASTEKGHYRYICYGQHKRNMPNNIATCTRRLNSQVVDNLIWTHIEGMLKNPAFLIEGLKQQAAEVEHSVTQLKDYIHTTNRAIEALDRQQAKLLDLYLDESGNFPKDMLQNKLDEINKERERYQQEKTDFERRIAQVTITEDQAEQIQTFCEIAKQGIENFTFDEKLAIIGVLNVKGVVHRGNTAKEDTITISGFIPTAILKQEDLSRIVPKQPIAFNLKASLTA